MSVPFEGPSLTLTDSDYVVLPQLKGAFEMESTDCSIFRMEWIPHYANLTALTDSNAPLEFTVNVEGSYYLDLKNSFINTRLRLTKNGEEIPATELVAPDSLLFHTMFEECFLYYNDRLISESSGLYGHQAYLDRLLKCSPNQKEWDLPREFFYENQTPDLFTDADPGFKERRDLTKGSKAFVVGGKPALGLFNQDRYIFPGSTIKLQMRRAPIEKILTAGIEIQDASVYKLEILSATFMACRKMIQDKVLDFHRKQVGLGRKFIFSYKDAQMRSFTIAKGMSSFEVDSLIIGMHIFYTVCEFSDDARPRAN